MYEDTVKIKPRSLTFKANGYKYITVDEVQTSDNQIIAIVKGTKDTIVTWEIHILRLLLMPPFVAHYSPEKSKQYTHYWKRPRNEDFGTYAASFGKNETAAFTRFALLVHRICLDSTIDVQGISQYL